MNILSTMQPRIDPAQRTLADRTRLRLEGLILSGELPAGTRINELELSLRFGVSRAPIREAIGALEQARLVTREPHRGATVSFVDLPSALELYEVRAGLARTAGRLLAQRITTTQLKMLYDLHKLMSAAAKSQDGAAFHVSNLTFHDSIFTFAANARLSEIENSVRKELLLYLRRGSQGSSQLRASNAEHAAFLKALEKGDADSAGRLLEQHVLNGRQRMIDNVHRHGH